MRVFGGEQIAKVMDFLKIEEDQAIENNMVSKAIESAQKKVESFFFDQRKRLVEFDDVMNKQREIIYRRRRNLLEAATVAIKDKSEDSDDKLKTVIENENGQEVTLKNQILDYISNEVGKIVTLRAPVEFTDDEYDAIVKDFVKIIPFDDNSQKKLVKKISKLEGSEEILEELMEVVHKTYESREKVVGEAVMRELEKYVVLATIDEKWMDHLDAIEGLREGIWLRGDKNTVLAEYKREAFNMFEDLIANVEETISQRIFRIQTRMQKTVVPEDIHLEKKKSASISAAKNSDEIKQTNIQSGNSNDLASALGSLQTNREPEQEVKKQAAKAKEKVGRNDPCPCGSGLKYKKCGLLGKCDS
jgi:preprotein translocase subunit SecA